MSCPEDPRAGAPSGGAGRGTWSGGCGNDNAARPCHPDRSEGAQGHNNDEVLRLVQKGNSGAQEGSNEPPRRAPLVTQQPFLQRWFPNFEWVLLIVLFFEVAAFSRISTNFLTWSNAFEIARLSVEMGLLAVALTPVIVAGGIDLSVGSLLGLSAVLFGMMCQKFQVPLPGAAILTVAVGLLGGGLNALLITRLRVPPLIVTLGTYSLYRGLAEGLTRGIENYTVFSPGFLYLGQGYLFGLVPAQLPLFVVVVVGFWLLLHRTALGRGLGATGFSEEGTRYAGIPVVKHLALVYVLCGLASSLAALVYVAHLGQAKADAGTGYELMAITAVVLGGTSIFGGRGTVHGTLLGLFVIVILQNGLRLAALPTELAGILTGLLLIGAIGGREVTAWLRTPLGAADSEVKEMFKMKNSQVAVLSVAMLLSALIVAGSNWVLVKRISQQRAAPTTVTSTTASAGPATAGRELTLAMMPKAKGNPYFISCRKGAEEAAKELGVELIWDGPTDTDPAKQNEVVEAWITKGVDVIAVSVENKEGISTVLRKARQKGIGVVTWDADSERDARDFLINQATPQGIGYTLTDEAAEILNGRGEFAIITSSLTAANQNEWIKHIKKRLADKYASLKLVTIRPCDDQMDRALAETQTLLKVYPNVKVVMGICSPSVPGAAEAVKQSGRTDVKVLGLALPNDCKPYIHSGLVPCIVLWNTSDLGYLTVYAAKALREGILKPGVKSLKAGRLGNLEVAGDEVLLGKPFVFTKDNVDQFDF